MSQKTAMLGLRLYVLALCAGFLAAAGLLVLLYLLQSKIRHHRGAMRVNHASGLIPTSSSETRAITVTDQAEEGFDLRPRDEGCDRSTGMKSSVAECSSSSSPATVAVEKIGDVGWGRWFSLMELEVATGDFNGENIIGKGGYGIVYRGVLPDLSMVAVKNLLDNKGQAEEEFKVEMQAIGKARHKNLVGLIGFCSEGLNRMLVYDYVDNGTLDHWLHGDVGPVSPLTWDIRMKIATGTAKGIAYLHEGLEPKVVHRDIKSSNILLDKKWNPKVSDFGLAKLLGSDSSYVTTRVMGTFGYVAPEYASTGMLNEGSDVYSFGVLLMEIISGRSPVDYGRPSREVNLVDWFKGMIGTKRGEEVVDPLIEVQPSPRALKRLLLVCLRCIDSDALKRPKMGQIVHMLEGDEFPFRTEHRLALEVPFSIPATTNRVSLLTKNVGSVESERSIYR